MPLSLYRRLELNKLTPTKISLQMADKSTAIPVGTTRKTPTNGAPIMAINGASVVRH